MAGDHTKAGYGAFGWFACGLAALFYCYEYLLRIQPSVMSAELMRYYSIDATAFGNLFAVYYYVYTPMQIVVGLMLDRHGPRISLTTACLACAAGALLFARSRELHAAQAARLLMGLGSSFAFAGVMKVASIWLPPGRFATIAGLVTALGMIAGMLGNNLMTAIVSRAGWRATVHGSATAGGILALCLWCSLRPRRASHRDAVDPPMTLKGLLGQVSRLLSERQTWVIAGIGGILYTSLSVFAELWGVPFLEQGKHFPRQEAASAVSMVFLGWAVGGPIVGYVSDRLDDQRSPLIIGGVLGAACIGVVTFAEGLPISLIGLLLFLFGAAASTENIVFAIAKDTAGGHLAGTAVAVTNMFVMLAGMILQPLVGWILDCRWDGTTVDGVRHYGQTVFEAALPVIPILFIVASGLAAMLRRTYRSAHEDGGRRRRPPGQLAGMRRRGV